MLPFSRGQFFEVFAAYNTAIWPMQLGLLAVALAAVLSAFRGGPMSRTFTFGFLALLWAWIGVLYHFAFFSHINPVAYAFALASIVQAALFAWEAAEGTIVFKAGRNLDGYAGGLLIGFALVGYPLVAFLAGQRYPAVPTFGAPCPTTIFTFGILLWSAGRMPRYLLVIPVAWAMVGSSAAWLLGVPEDAGLPVAALVSTLLLLRRNRTLGAALAPLTQHEASTAATKPLG